MQVPKKSWSAFCFFCKYLICCFFLIFLTSKQDLIADYYMYVPLLSFSLKLAQNSLTEAHMLCPKQGTIFWHCKYFRWKIDKKLRFSIHNIVSLCKKQIMDHDIVLNKTPISCIQIEPFFQLVYIHISHSLPLLRNGLLRRVPWKLSE
jgi:hypothetical protein